MFIAFSLMLSSVMDETKTGMEAEGYQTHLVDPRARFFFLQEEQGNRKLGCPANWLAADLYQGSSAAAWAVQWGQSEIDLLTRIRCQQGGLEKRDVEEGS